MVEREHRVRLAAAEVGLQLHDRVSAAAAEALHGAGEHPLEALGQVGAAEELDRVAVLGAPFPFLDLPEVGGELGLLVLAAGDVLVRRDHLAPRLQGAGRAADGEAGLLAPFAAGLLVEADAQQLHLEPVDLGGLGGRDRGQQPAGRVERAVGVVSGERTLMGPVVAVVAQLADEVALGPPEDGAEHVVPRLPHQLEERRDVPLGHRPVADQWIVDEPPQGGGVDALRLDRPLDLAVDERAEPRLQQLERLADPFVIGCRHVVGGPVRRSSRPRQPARRPRPRLRQELHPGPPWYASVGYRLVAPLTGPERRHPDHPARLAHVRLTERR